MKNNHGGAREGAGRPRLRRRISRDAALALRLLTWQRLGRPATDEEEDQTIEQLIMESAQRQKGNTMNAVYFSGERGDVRDVVLGSERYNRSNCLLPVTTNANRWAWVREQIDGSTQALRPMAYAIEGEMSAGGVAALQAGRSAYEAATRGDRPAVERAYDTLVAVGCAPAAERGYWVERWLTSLD